MAEITSIVREELRRLWEHHGELTPRLVLDAAQEEDSPLHNHFEWDFELAAEKHQLRQASELIRRANVRIIAAEDRPPVTVRAFISIEREDKVRVYHPQDIVSADAAMRGQALKDMEQDWKSLRRKYEHYHEFWSLIAEAIPVTA